MRTFVIEEQQIVVSDDGKIQAWEVTVRERDGGGENVRRVINLWRAAPQKMMKQVQDTQNLLQAALANPSFVSTHRDWRWMWLRRRED